MQVKQFGLRFGLLMPQESSDIVICDLSSVSPKSHKPLAIMGFTLK